MKMVKKAVTLVIVMVMLVSILVFPASAASLSTQVRSEFGSFATVHWDNTYSGYTYALQRFLQCANQAYATYLKNGRTGDYTGVDGFFGEGTNNALVAYQGNRGLTADGWAGYNTWMRIADDMQETAYYTYRLLTINNKAVMVVFMEATNNYPSYYVYYDGNGSQGARFHTCS